MEDDDEEGEMDFEEVKRRLAKDHDGLEVAEEDDEEVDSDAYGDEDDD
jgi:hypothetical protein